MGLQHDKSFSDDNIVLKGGQSGLSCCNNKSEDCPLLRYVFIESLADVEQAFDILFTDVFNDLNKNDSQKDSHIL